jgi:hypothetical protein
MRFGGEIKQRVTSRRQRLRDILARANIAFYKGVPLIVKTMKIVKISGVCKSIEIDHADGRIIFHREPDKSRTNKSGPAGHKDSDHKTSKEPFRFFPFSPFGASDLLKYRIGAFFRRIDIPQHDLSAFFAGVIDDHIAKSE